MSLHSNVRRGCMARINSPASAHYACHPKRSTKSEPFVRESYDKRMCTSEKSCISMTGETHFRVALTAQRKCLSHFRAHFGTRVQTWIRWDCRCASHVILLMTALHDDKSVKQATLGLAAREIAAVESQREILAEHVTIPLCLLGRVIRKHLQLTAIWAPKSLTLSCVNKSGTAHGFMQCPIKEIRLSSMLFNSGCCSMAYRCSEKARRSFHHSSGNSYTWQRFESSEKDRICLWPPRLWILSKKSLQICPNVAYLTWTLMLSTFYLDKAYCRWPCLARVVLRVVWMPRPSWVTWLHAYIYIYIYMWAYTHPVVWSMSIPVNKPGWLNLLHMIALHRPAHLQHDYTTVLLQVGDVLPVQSFPSMWEAAKTTMIGR